MAPPPGASCVDADMLVRSKAFWSLGLTSGERGGGKPGIGIVPAVLGGPFDLVSRVSKVGYGGL